LRWSTRWKTSSRVGRVPTPRCPLPTRHPGGALPSECRREHGIAGRPACCDTSHHPPATARVAG
jgi:hypothetical protein